MECTIAVIAWSVILRIVCNPSIRPAKIGSRFFSSGRIPQIHTQGNSYPLTVITWVILHYDISPINLIFCVNVFFIITVTALILSAITGGIIEWFGKIIYITCATFQQSYLLGLVGLQS